MIRECVSRPVPQTGTSADVRLLAAYDNYGAYPFARFWEDGEGRFCSLIDGTAVFAATDMPSEWQLFLRMMPSVSAVHSAAPMPNAGSIDDLIWNGGAAPRCDALSAKDAYLLMADAFSLPPFDVWYADVSHRSRHAGCRMRGIFENGMAVSMAMTVAETPDAALIGGVVTDPAHRRQGLAGRVVSSLAAELSGEGKQVWITPADDTALRLYQTLGFKRAGKTYFLR